MALVVLPRALIDAAILVEHFASAVLLVVGPLALILGAALPREDPLPMHGVVAEATRIVRPTGPLKTALAIFLVVAPVTLVNRVVRVLDLAFTVAAIVLELARVGAAAGPREGTLAVASVRPPIPIVAAPIRVGVILLLLGDFHWRHWAISCVR